ncbi:Hypothetical predicted protein [Octopus vulgaris]|uniref:Uncharacterized protein n=1 Tax=Octopus vulgaris TaxID=6645 RepID=A0AA36AZA0_OCTVU|nr:Hypothetical predicted protein [Octopus vulgaris]
MFRSHPKTEKKKDSLSSVVPACAGKIATMADIVSKLCFCSRVNDILRSFSVTPPPPAVKLWRSTGSRAAGSRERHCLLETKSLYFKRPCYNGNEMMGYANKSYGLASVN